MKGTAPFLTLGIETSCDETAASIVADGREIRSAITASQFVHSQYGGVVPELASRAHVRLIVPIVQTALDVAHARLSDVNLVAATCAPGLLGALLVGLPFGKALAWGRNLPFVGVNHLEGHLFAIFLDYPDIELPIIALIVSGGHTELVVVQDRCRYQTIGATLDDACGETFDKAAKMLGFPYPGGTFIEDNARRGTRSIKFPAPRLEDLNFSFSGLKTALLYYLRDHPGCQCEDVCHSFQETLIDALLDKLSAAVDRTAITRVAVTGGVAVNRRLRERVTAAGRNLGFVAYFPGPELCTDNAAVIAAAGYARFQRFGGSPLSLPARSRQALDS
jgi:N6-L-threonylcarbamoyladenine synthase